MQIKSQSYYSANSADFTEFNLLFSTSNGSNSQTGADSTPFYGAASCTITGNGVADATWLGVQQNSQTLYTFYVYCGPYPG